MQLSDIFLALGEPTFTQILRSVSIGKLKTFQLYERVKLRFHLNKLNSDSLRKAAPRLYARIAEHDEEFATDIAQTILVSHLDMIKAVLDSPRISTPAANSPKAGSSACMISSTRRFPSPCWFSTSITSTGN
jgi:hypothetical protein